MDPLTSNAGKLFIATEGARADRPARGEPPADVQDDLQRHGGRGTDHRLLGRRAASPASRFLPDTTSFGESAKQVIAARTERRDHRRRRPASTRPQRPHPADQPPRRKNPQAYLAWTTAPSGVTFLRNVRAVVPTRRARAARLRLRRRPVLHQAGAAGVGTILTSPKLPVYDLLPDSDPRRRRWPRSPTPTAPVRRGAQRVAGQAYDAVRWSATAIETAGGTPTAPSWRGDRDPGRAHRRHRRVPVHTAQDHSGLAPDNVVMIQWDGTRFVPVT